MTFFNNEQQIPAQDKPSSIVRPIADNNKDAKKILVSVRNATIYEQSNMPNESQLNFGAISHNHNLLGYGLSAPHNLN